MTEPQQESWRERFRKQFGDDAETIAFRSWEKLDECEAFISTERQRVLDMVQQKFEERFVQDMGYPMVCADYRYDEENGIKSFFESLQKELEQQ